MTGQERQVVKVFFYGLFMDAKLLREQGLQPIDAGQGVLNGFELRIGERATLVRQAGGSVYGVVMMLSRPDVISLYAQPSVADYLPEAVTVDLLSGGQVDATCYNLPEDKVAGANPGYVQSLLNLATTLAFPDAYLSQIKRLGTGGSEQT